MEKSPQDSIIDMNLRIPFSTILVVLLTLLCVNMIQAIASLFFPLFFGILIAVSLNPIVMWLETRRIPKWISILFVTLALGIFFIAFIVIMAPRIYQQAAGFVENLPALRDQALALLPEKFPAKKYIEHSLNDDKMFLKVDNLQQVFNAGHALLGGIGETLLVFVFAIYLLSDGKSAIRWFNAFFTPSTQKKLDETRLELSKIVSAYIFGQVITSAMSFIFAFVTLSILKVPNALLLATLAGVFDILPVLGFFFSAIPACLFALNVSPETALIVLGLYLIYHGFENYLIVPWVYGNRLRVSGIVVFFTLLASGLIAGVEGAIAVLPIIASYPVIERIWLNKYVSEKAVKVHAKITKSKT